MLLLVYLDILKFSSLAFPQGIPQLVQLPYLLKLPLSPKFVHPQIQNLWWSVVVAIAALHAIPHPTCTLRLHSVFLVKPLLGLLSALLFCLQKHFSLLTSPSFLNDFVLSGDSLRLLSHFPFKIFKRLLQLFDQLHIRWRKRWFLFPMQAPAQMTLFQFRFGHSKSQQFFLQKCLLPPDLLNGGLLVRRFMLDVNYLTLVASNVQLLALNFPIDLCFNVGEIPLGGFMKTRSLDVPA